MRKPFTAGAILILHLVVASATLAQDRNTDIDNIGNRDINKGYHPMTMSADSEVAMGLALSREFEQTATLLNEPAVTDYVNRVSQLIARNSDVKVPITVKIVDSAEINAMALPGGWLYINAGLITTVDSEAELAAMVAHCVAHVAARHAVEQQGRASFLNILPLPSTLFSGGIVGTAMAQNGSIANPAMLFKFSREAEEEADFLGLQYLYKAGYDPDAMVRFFQRMTALGPGKPVSSTFSTHPPTEERASKTATNIQRFLPPRQDSLVTTAEFQTVRDQLVARMPK